MEIRRAVEPDIPQILSMLNSKDSEDISKRIEETNQGESLYLVAEENGQVVGHVTLNWKGKKSEPDSPDISGAFVKEDYRSNGIGREIIKRCEELAKERGFSKISLAVNPTLNPRALKLYEQLGYRQTNTPSYIDGVYNGTEDWVVDMVKELK